MRISSHWCSNIQGWTVDKKIICHIYITTNIKKSHSTSKSQANITIWQTLEFFYSLLPFICTSTVSHSSSCSSWLSSWLSWSIVDFFSSFKLCISFCWRRASYKWCFRPFPCTSATISNLQTTINRKSSFISFAEYLIVILYLQ